MKRTAFFHDERTLWHIAGAPHALMLPVGRWVQPMAGVGIAEAPDTKRRLKSLARMLLHPESFRLMTRHAMALAERHAGGRLVMVHEGGYSEVAVPLCGLAILEELSGHRTEVEDPLTPFFGLMQPSARFDAFQLGLIEELAALHGLRR